MITKWRSPDWVNPYGKPRMGKKASRWYELGADAMLQSLRAMGEIVMDAETGINGLNVVIPDDPLDPQPVSKTDEFKQPTYALHQVGNNEIHNRCAGKPVYDSSCPFCREIQSLKDRAINHSKMWQHHPASKVIEKGYFGIHAFVQVPTWVEIPSKGWTWQDWYTFTSIN